MRGNYHVNLVLRLGNVLKMICRKFLTVIVILAQNEEIVYYDKI